MPAGSCTPTKPGRKVFPQAIERRGADWPKAPLSAPPISSSTHVRKIFVQNEFRSKLRRGSLTCPLPSSFKCSAAGPFVKRRASPAAAVVASISSSTHVCKIRMQNELRSKLRGLAAGPLPSNIKGRDSCSGGGDGPPLPLPVAACAATSKQKQQQQPTPPQTCRSLAPPDGVPDLMGEQAMDFAFFSRLRERPAAATTAAPATGRKPAQACRMRRQLSADEFVAQTAPFSTLARPQLCEILWSATRVIHRALQLELPPQTISPQTAAAVWAHFDEARLEDEAEGGPQGGSKPRVPVAAASRPPPVSMAEIEQFLTIALLTGNFSCEALICALCVLVRFLRVVGPGGFDGSTWRLACVTTLMVGQKALEDDGVDVSDFVDIYFESRVAGGAEAALSPRTLNALELVLLGAIDFRVFVGPCLFARVYFELHAMFVLQYGGNEAWRPTRDPRFRRASLV